MKLQTPELILEYYEREKDKYPEITFEQFKNICLSSWKYVKKEMESGELPDIRMKYLGVFSVYKGTAINQLRSLSKKLKEEKITKKQHDHLEQIIKKRIERYENK